jgi:uncharacterized membrane protein YdbT with pleckstrin-like domain
LFFWLVIPVFVAIWKKFSLVLKVTEDKVIIEKGILSKKKKEVFASDVRTIDIEKSMLQRMFGIGDIKIAAAGTGGYEDVAYGMANPEEIKEAIDNRRRKG